MNNIITNIYASRGRKAIMFERVTDSGEVLKTCVMPIDEVNVQTMAEVDYYGLDQDSRTQNGRRDSLGGEFIGLVQNDTILLLPRYIPNFILQKLGVPERFWDSAALRISVLRVINNNGVVNWDNARPIHNGNIFIL